MSPLHDLSSKDVRKLTNVLGHCKCCSGFLVMMKLLVIMLMCLLGYVGTDANIGCVKMAVMTGSFTCADRMQSIFIIEAYMVNRHGCPNDNLRNPEYQTLKAEITNFMKITCNARTECHFYKSLLQFNNNNISKDQEYPYVIDYSCEWLYPVTPILHGQQDKVYSASGNQFVLQSKNYPRDNAPALDTNCSISFQPQSGEYIVVSLKDLHINGAINGGSESDINKYCIKSTSSVCMSAGNTNTLPSGSISLQKTSAVTYVRYYILIYVSKSGSINDKPLNRTFSLSCTNAEPKIPDVSISATAPTSTLTLAPAPSVPPSIPTSPTIVPTTTSNPSDMERDFTTTEKASSLPAAVGGTLAGVLLIALCVVLFFLWRRKQGNRKEMDSEKSTQVDNGKSLQNQPPEYVNVVSPKQGNNDVSYEPLDSDLIKHNGVNGGAPVHPKDISPSKPTSVNHMEVNGDVYALPGTVSPKKSQIKPPIATKPHLASQRSIPAAAAAEDDVDDVEICDNIIYHNI